MADKWMQSVHPKKGALHRMMHVPQGQKISTAALRSAANSSNALKAKRANLALRYRGLGEGGVVMSGDVAEAGKEKVRGQSRPFQFQRYR